MGYGGGGIRVVRRKPEYQSWNDGKSEYPAYPVPTSATSCPAGEMGVKESPGLMRGCCSRGVNWCVSDSHPLFFLGPGWISLHTWESQFIAIKHDSELQIRKPKDLSWLQCVKGKDVLPPHSEEKGKENTFLHMRKRAKAIYWVTVMFLEVWSEVDATGIPSRPPWVSFALSVPALPVSMDICL